MPRRQAILKAMLEEAGYAIKPGLPRPSAICRQTGDTETWAEVDRVYRQLDGILPHCPIKPGSWDIELVGVAIELDEEQHFNRYRAATLQSVLYEGSRFPVTEYRSFCQLHESECLRKAAHGGYWASCSTVFQFGPPGDPRDLSQSGAPRWKQRAFYDFLKDLAPILTGTVVARIAIWDTVEVEGAHMLVKDLLDSRQKQALPELVDLIKRRCGIELAV